MLTGSEKDPIPNAILPLQKNLGLMEFAVHRTNIDIDIASEKDVMRSFDPNFSLQFGWNLPVTWVSKMKTSKSNVKEQLKKNIHNKKIYYATLQQFVCYTSVQIGGWQDARISCKYYIKVFYLYYKKTYQKLSVCSPKDLDCHVSVWIVHRQNRTSFYVWKIHNKILHIAS